MGLPFTIVQGLIGVMDTAGNIVETALTAGKRRLAAQSTIIGTNEPYYEAHVIYKNGMPRLVTDSTVTVEQIFGQDDYADNWFWIDYAGATGDTVRIQIPAFVDPTGTEMYVPPSDITITLTSLEAGKEIALRDKIIAVLNNTASFSQYWKATVIKDNAIVHISSKFIGEIGERLGINGLVITTTGTTQIRRAYEDIKRRGKANSGQRDPRDRRLVTVGISGEVTAVPGAVGDLFIRHVTNNVIYGPLGFDDLRVNGSVTPVPFNISPDTTMDIYIKELRFFGNGNGIKFGQFLSTSALTNGILVEVKSDDKIITFDPIRTTDDFKHEFSFGTGQGFQLHVQSGRDDFLAAFTFDSPFPLRKIGTFATDDYIRVTIRDNLTSGLLVLQFIAFGFKREV
jgi:hypothetical protein